jgi:2-polyprenyl-3-methyl-5-hydroxy-6-metoxy-1,4-benzoquinol methylase
MSKEMSTREHWDGIYRTVPSSRPHAGAVRRFAGRVRGRKLQAVLADFLGAIPGRSGRVLELGCAPAVMLEYLHRAGPQYELHGVDYSPEGVEVARRRLESAGIAAQIHQGDFRSFDPPERFDLVVSFGLIEHFDDPIPILREHIRLCAPGGHVGVTVPNLAPFVVERLARHFAPKTMETHVLAIMQPDAIQSALEQAGLECVRSGRSGGPHLSAAIEPGHRFAGAYRRFATLWNLAAEVLPFDFPWQRTVWGIGRVPR